MKRKYFTPSENWVLEDRIALSHGHAGIAAEVAPSLASIAGLSGTVHGTATSRLTLLPGAGQTVSLSGSSKFPQVGLVKVTGTLGGNPSLPPSPNGTQGTLTLIGPKSLGSLTLGLNGPTTNLAPTTPTTSHDTFTVLSGTGLLGGYDGVTGTADLTLSVRIAKHGVVGHGPFTLVLTIG